MRKHPFVSTPKPPLFLGEKSERNEMKAVCPYCFKVVELNERGEIPMMHLMSQDCKEGEIK